MIQQTLSTTAHAITSLLTAVRTSVEALTSGHTADRPAATATASHTVKRATRASDPMKAEQPSASDIRVWAKREGIAVAARGTISQDVKDAYQAAHSAG